MDSWAKKSMREIAGKVRAALENSRHGRDNQAGYDGAWLWAMGLAAESALAARNITAKPPGFLAIAEQGKVRRPSAECLAYCRNILMGEAFGRISGSELFRAPDALGWLHQYWHDGERELITAETINDGYSKIDAEQITPRTQVYTEKYMVDFLLQNSLGALWLSVRPDSLLVSGWDFYVKYSSSRVAKIKTAREITLIDPACGSGNFLLAAFDMFYSMYVEEDPGQDSAQICKAIFDNNLFGLDIDDKAVEVARTALWLRAAEKAPGLTDADVAGICRNIVATGKETGSTNAAELGSLVKFEALSAQGALSRLLSRRYAVAVTNPPYIDKRDYSANVRTFLRRHYPAGAGNLYAAFILRCLALADCYTGMITPQSFLFIKSYTALRKEMFRQSSVRVLAHLGLGAFADAVVDTAMFVLKKEPPNCGQKADGVYFKLIDDSRKETALLTAIMAHREGQRTDKVFELPMLQATVLEGSPVAYWLGGRLLSITETSKKLRDYADVVLGMKTSDNKRFVRMWWEVEARPDRGWIPYEKEASGYRFQRSSAHAVRWTSEACEFYRQHYSAQLPNPRYWFKAGIVFGLISSKAFTAKLLPPGHMSDMAASCVFPHSERDIYFFLALLNSKIYQWLLKIFNPTVNYQPIDLQRLPVPDSVLAKRNVLGNCASVAAAAAGALRRLEVTDRAYLFDEAALLPLGDKLAGIIERIWLDSLRYVLAHDAIDLHLADALDLPLGERRRIAAEIGENASANIMIESYEQLPESVDKSILVCPAGCVPNNPEAVAALKTKLGQLYRTGLRNGAAGFPEEFLQQAALELRLHPLTVYQLLKQGIEREQWRCPALEKKLVEDFFSALVLSILGHRWPEEKFGGSKKRKNMAPVYQYQAEQTIYELVCQVIVRYGDLASTEKEFTAIVGCSLQKWLAKDFFARHVRQFKRRPVVWQVSSRPLQGNARISWLVYYRQAKELTEYLKNTVGLNTNEGLDRLGMEQEMNEFIFRLNLLADYKYEMDYGIRVNIAPLQKNGLLAAKVLHPGDEEKALEDYRAWAGDFF